MSSTTFLYTCCQLAFGSEWDALGNLECHLVSVDVENIADAPEDDAEKACNGSLTLAAKLLAKRVGKGNLASYASCLVARRGK